MPFVVDAIAHTGITVADMDQSLAFWRDLLGFQEVVNNRISGEPAEKITGIPGADLHFVIVQCPGHRIELVQYLGPQDRQHLRPRPCDVGSLHVAFAVDDIAAVLADVAAYGWTAPGAAQTVSDGPFAGTAFVYMYDPDGTVVELIQSPRSA